MDGDTLWYEGKKIRVEDIDAPEIAHPKCASENALGEKAKYRFLELMNAGPFKLVRHGDRDTDRYGRLLRVVERDGQSLGMILVNEGFAGAGTAAGILGADVLAAGVAAKAVDEKQRSIAIKCSP